MTTDRIKQIYRTYIDCLNSQDWDSLHSFVDHEVTYNGKRIGVDGYRNMLIEDFRAIPDLFFKIAFLICEPPMIASRLTFDCTPVGMLFEMPVNGRRVRFDENAFYSFADGRIRNVWSVIDKAAIRAQL